MAAGTVLPLKEFSKVPKILQKKQYFLFPDGKATSASEPEPAQLNYTLNTQYSVNDTGHRRAIEREVINLNRAQEEQEPIEEALAVEPDEQTKAAMAIAEEEHQMMVQGEIANQQFKAKERERADEVARDFVKEQQTDDLADANHMVTPNVSAPAPEEWTPQLSRPKLRRRFVQRGSVFRRAKDANVKLKIGERVFVKTGSRYDEVGVVEPGGRLPLIYKED